MSTLVNTLIPAWFHGAKAQHTVRLLIGRTLAVHEGYLGGLLVGLGQHFFFFLKIPHLLLAAYMYVQRREGVLGRAPIVRDKMNC
jgi:uncharacterized iron-regulated membrane protein